MTEESAVKVCVRVRPLVEREEISALENAEPVQLFWKADKKSIHQIDDGNSSKSFNFDRVFSAEESTNQLYQAIAKPLVVSTVEGYNGTIFAYGQTCSGKTFTMMGSDRSPGVIPLAVEEVFQTIKNFPKKEFLLRVSYMEIYNETVSDLLVDSWKRKPLEVRETMNKNIYVADLTEEMVTSPSQVLAWIRKGEKNRHYGATKMNQRSSRSHTIFRMILESRERSDPASGENADGAIIVSNLNLVDLAGSERASQTGAEGARFKEGCNINRSLFTLAQVIKKVTDENQKGFTNYRDSKLTRILQNSLGGNAKTVIICTITPASLEETLSTLQFASTAKKMKNDPHVTEVSDDGALLKRYRNEITDLKRRLQEVSSVTQTTATEKEVLAQLLQEKDQLQREQEDRIRNLTKLLVTSSNVVPVQKVPKRRVTWGGKMLRLARPSVCGGGSSDLSFAESFSRKRKVNNSSFVELDEDDEYFESHWGIPEEPPDDLETNQSSVTVRSFADSPRDFESPDRICELSEKASNLQLQLEMVSQQREEVMTKAETLNGRVQELELQLQEEAQEKLEAVEKAQTTEQRVGELEKQLQTQAQEKLEAVQCLELRVLDLERHLEEMNHNEAEEQMRKEFAETIQLCETLAAEKDTVIAERDYLKEELGMFIEQTENLEKEKAALSQELKERRDLDEFKSLEEGCRKEHETELHGELSSLKKSIESYELQCQELQIKLQTVSEELKKKTEFAEELQNMSGKDLVQEVATLRRSLDDAEGVSRDTKKEWAFLRSQNIALEEQNTTLTDSHKKMEAELNSLHVQLEMERSRNRKMQTDLQKELNIAFEENTKLTTLLDGKVPKNLIDSVELERTVANLNKELTESHESKDALTAQLEDLASLQTLPEKVESLTKQVCDLSEELQALKSQRDGLLSVQAEGQDEAQQLRDSLQTSQEEILKIQADLQASALREDELSRQCADATQQLDSLRSDLQQVCAERGQLMASVDERDMKAAETRALLQSLQHELQEQKQRNSDLVKSLEQKESEVGEHMQRLSQELQRLQNEKESLQATSVQSSAEEAEGLHSAIASLTEERDQLKLDLQENVELMIENQEELRTALEKNRELMKQVKLQETAQTSKLDGPSDISSQLEDLQANMKTLSEELDCVRMERDGLLSEMTASTQTSKEEMEQLLCRITSLTEQRDQLLETVDGLQLEKNQLREEMEQKMEMLAQPQHGPEKTEMLTSVLPEDDKQTQLYQEIKTLTEKLENAQMESDALRLEKAASQASTEDMEKLLCRVTSLTEERDQLQQILEGLREEKKQLRAELEDRLETMQLEFQHQATSEVQQLTDEQEAQRLLQIQQLEERLEMTNSEVNQLKSDLQQNVEVMIETQEELKASQEKNKVLQEQVTMLRSQAAELESRQNRGNYSESAIQRLTEELESMRAERESLLSERTANPESSKEELEKLHDRVMSLSKERDELQEVLDGLRQEKRQLRSESEERMESLLDEVSQLTTSLHTVTEQKKQLEDDLQQNMKMLSSTQDLLKTIQEELCEQRTINSNLEKLSQEKESSLVEKMEDLEKKLESVEALLSENESNHQTHMEEKQQLLCQVASLTEERQQLQEILEGLRREKQQLKLEQDDRIQSLQAEIKEMATKLQSDEAERKSLLSEKNLNRQTYTEEMENLLGRVASVSEERDQLQQMLDGMRREEQQLRAELDHGMTSLQKEVSQLTTSLHTVTEQKKQLEDDLQQNMKMLSSTQDLLKTIQEELCEQRTINSNLEKLSQEKESSLVEKVKTLTERLNLAEAERDSLLSVREATTHHSLETEKLLCSVTSLSKEKEELQKMVQALMEEEKQLRAELETKVEMVLSIQEKLSQEEQLNRRQQTEKGEQEAQLEQKVQQLEEQVKIHSEKHTRVKAEAEASQQSLSEANATISALTAQLNTLEQGRKQIKERASSRLQESAGHLQESFGKFQQLIDTCSKYKSSPLFNVLNLQLKHSLLTALPKPTLDAYEAMCELVLQTVQKLMNTEDQLHERAYVYRNMFEELVNKDLAVFEEKRVQDVLQCRAQAPGYSVKDEDFSALWEHRLNELVDKRQSYLQKMGSIFKKLDATMTAFLIEMKTEIIERQKFKQQLRAMIDNQPVNVSGLDEALIRERDRLSALAQNSSVPLQGPLQITADEHNCFIDELKQLLAQADSQLREEKSKNSTLLQALEGAPLKTELSLMKENQQLTVQLQQAEENIKVLHAQTEQLEEAQRQANSRVSTHKEATQLLQTELQDSRALVEEKEGTIQALKSKLRESEKRALPVEQETLQDKLFKLEVQLTSISDEHQQEIQRMNKLLGEKEESLRKLKETLRKSQQEGECSFLQGEDLHARLTNPRGVVTASSVLVEKNKLEEEVRQLQLKITQLESLVSSQQAEISKWKNRAFKLKVKNKADLDKPSSPCTPTKRVILMTSDSTDLSSPAKFQVSPKKPLASPLKVLDSPWKQLDSPKSSFFDVDGTSERLSRKRPKQFFDNSGLGILPGTSEGTNTKEWWSDSAKEDMCKTQ